MWTMVYPVTRFLTGGSRPSVSPEKKVWGCMYEFLDQVVRQVPGLISGYGFQAIGIITILVIGWLGAGWVQLAIRGALTHAGRGDEVLWRILASTIRYVLIAVTVTIVLSQFGIETTGIIVLLGAVGLAAALALQGALSNGFAGIMILSVRPFKIGDNVELNGVYGTVKSTSLIATELTTPDNIQILVPNRKIWNAAIHNYSFHTTRRINLTVGIGYGDDLDKAIKAAYDVICADYRFLCEPLPNVAVSEFSTSAVNLSVHAWCEAEDYSLVKQDLIKALKERFDEEGFSVSYAPATSRTEPTSVQKGTRDQNQARNQDQEDAVVEHLKASA